MSKTPTMPAPRAKLCYRLNEAADLIGISRRQVNRLIATRQLRAVRFGPQSVGVAASELQRFLDAGGVSQC
jgi:excisionase family DNA binding protein